MNPVIGMFSGTGQLVVAVSPATPLSRSRSTSCSNAASPQ